MPAADPDALLISPRRAVTSNDTTLVELVDRVLDRGCVIEGELWLTVADIDLVYLGLKAVLTTPDRVTREQGKGRTGMTGPSAGPGA